MSGMPELDITDGGPAAIRELRRLLDSGGIPGTFVRDGAVVHLQHVSGTPDALSGDDDAPLPVSADVLRSPGLAALLAEHTYTYRFVASKGANAEVTPPAGVLSAVLESREWPNLQPLTGIIGAPVLRPDGSLLQEQGYDKVTGLYLAMRAPLGHVPDEPTAEQVDAARSFLLDRLLRDFPWVSAADRANYLGLMATSVLLKYLRSLAPFGLITSSSPASGKTILASALGASYGRRVLSWSGSEDELRKAVTSVLPSPEGVIVFDNLPEGTVIDSAILARLLTERRWSDRLLGGNKVASIANDRVWVATLNNGRVGGDLRSRSVLVRLDPDMDRPEERTGFTIDHLDAWIMEPANQREVLRHLLILIADWTAAGAPRKRGVAMRQFTAWAEGVGGFLEHHGVSGFLANADSLRGLDDDEAMWTALYRQWHELFGDTWVGSTAVRKSADIGPDGTDRWQGAFLTDAKGYPVSAKSLGRLLTGQINRHRGGFALRNQRDSHTKSNVWRVERTGPES